jgi:hypothetical protein
MMSSVDRRILAGLTLCCACSGDIGVVAETGGGSSGADTSSGGPVTGTPGDTSGDADSDTPGTSSPSDESSTQGSSGTDTGTGSSTGDLDATVTVVPIGCEGTITSAPVGISCGAECSASFEPGTEVTLTAEPGDLQVRNWSGACLGSDQSCAFTVEEDTEVEVQFTDMRWMKALGGADDDVYGHPRAAVANDAGSVFVGGYYSGGVFQFGSPSGLPCVDAYTAGFVTKLTAFDGVEQWHHCLSTVDEQGVAQNSVTGLALEPASGDVFASGYFSHQPAFEGGVGAIDFGGGEVSCPPLSPDESGGGIFVVRYADVDGAHVWSHGFCTNSFVADSGASASDAAGDVYVVADVGAPTSAPFDLGGETFPADPSNGHTFVAKYDGDDGTHLWSVDSGDFTWSHGAAADDDNGLYLVGYSWNTFTGVVSRRDATDGSLVWTKTIAGEPGLALSDPFSVDVTDDGDIVVAGFALGPVDFGAGLVDFSTEVVDLFLAKFDGATGDVIWVKPMPCDMQGTGLTWADTHIDDNGDILMTSGFSGNCDLGGGPVASVGIKDLFITRYDSDDGSQLAQRSIPTGAGSDAVGEAITVDDQDNIFFAGHLAGEANYCGDELDTAGFDGILYGSLKP